MPDARGNFKGISLSGISDEKWERMLGGDIEVRELEPLEDHPPGESGCVMKVTWLSAGDLYGPEDDEAPQ